MNHVRRPSLAITLASSFALAGCASAPAPWSRCGCPCPTAIADPYLAAAAVHGRGGPAVWSFLSASYDADRDGRVTPAEYRREPKRFRGLDRDGDGSLTEADFAGPTRMDAYVAALVLTRIAARERPPSAEDVDVPDAATLALAVARADADRSGRIGEAELDRALAEAQRTPVPGTHDLPAGVRPFPSLAAAMDDDRSGDLSPSEVEAFRVRMEAMIAEEKERERAAAEKTEDPQNQAPKRPKPPEVGETAPDFALRSRDETRTTTLSSFRGRRPVAIVFGSYTCPPFRHAASWIRAAHERHGRDVQFLFVYVREAHAIDGPAPIPAPDQPVVEEPRTIEERLGVANACTLDLGFDAFETVVDGLDDAVAKAYEAPPARLYVVSRDGRIAYRGGRGPFGLDGPAFEAAVRAAASR